MGEHGVSLENVGNMENMENMEYMEKFSGSPIEIFSESPTEMFSGSPTEIFSGSLTQMFSGSPTEVNRELLIRICEPMEQLANFFTTRFADSICKVSHILNFFYFRQ